MPTPTGPALSAADAAAYLGGLSTQTMANWRSAGKGPRFVRLGARIVYRVADLDAYLEKHASKHRGSR